MKKRVVLLFAILLIGAFVLNACAPAPAPTEAPPAAETEAPPAAETEAPAAPAEGETVTLEYWTFADYASGEAGELQKTFIAEFEAANPGVKINMSPKNDDELTAGVVAAAASQTLPDIYVQSDDMGAQDVELGALENVYERWMAEPEDFRAQFNPVMVADMTPMENTMWGMPYTGYSSFLFRNLTVLKAAGIDPAEKVETWDQWLEQMKKIKEAGFQALPSMSLAYNDFVAMYAGVATDDEWGIDWDNKTTRLSAEKFAELAKFTTAAKEYGTDIGNRDQAAQDLFLSDKLAYRISGPWANPPFVEAKEASGLDYDFVVVPGISSDNAAGHRGTEFIGLAPDGKNKDIAWKFVMYICDEPQMTRWAELLSRYNSNQVTLSKVDDALLQVTTDGAVSALMVMPPNFIKAYPAGYNQAILDALAMIESGQVTPEEGAAQLVETLNQLVSEAE